MKSDVVVVGGGPAGVITALTTKRVYPELSVLLIKEIGDGVIPCAIPYMIHTLENPEQNKMGDMPLAQANVDVKVGVVTRIDPAANTVFIGAGDPVEYRRLVLATGAVPIRPDIPGIDLPGVYTIRKSLGVLKALREQALRSENIVILGGGFIGAEFADELAKMPGKRVHLVEIQERIMSTAFDDVFCDEIAETLTNAGVHLHTGKKLTAIRGDGKVDAVTLNDEEALPADMVIVGIGTVPETTLARDAGIRLSENGAIWVDSYMRTAVEGIFAVGDCALKRDFFTRKASPVMLASNATAEARIAGTNLLGIRVMRQVQGTISAFSTKIGDIAFASAGMTSRMCKEEGFRYVSATATAPDRHPGCLADTTPMKVKLVFADRSGILLGGQLSGGAAVGELINMLVFAIEKKATVREMEMMQIATHPLLTSAPTVHPLINAASLALQKMRVAATPNQ